jgi:hypothetical protein
MSRIFHCNFGFEHELVDPSFQPSRSLLGLFTQLSVAWIKIAQPGDIVWLPEGAPLPEFCPQDVVVTSSRTVLIDLLLQRQAPYDFIPWGWSFPALANFEALRSNGVRAEIPPLDIVKACNSRRFAWQQEERLGGVLVNGEAIEKSISSVLRTMGDVERWLGGMSADLTPWVIKAEFGMSGRERILSRRGATASQLQWCRKRLDAGELLIAEPWLDRIAEVGVQWHIAPGEDPRCVGITQLDCDAQGQYLTSHPIATERLAEHWIATIEHERHVVRVMAEAGYIGPVGIDAMLFRHRLGNREVEAIRPLQDINARWTMGRLVWEASLHRSRQSPVD